MPAADPQSIEVQGRPPRSRSGIVRVLIIAGIGAILIGAAGYTASVALTPDAPVPYTMCLDSNCTYAVSADGGPAPQPVRHQSHAAPERFVRKLLYICHIR